MERPVITEWRIASPSSTPPPGQSSVGSVGCLLCRDTGPDFLWRRRVPSEALRPSEDDRGRAPGVSMLTSHRRPTRALSLRQGILGGVPALLALAGCVQQSKPADSGSAGGGGGGFDSGICSLATDPDRDGYCADDCAPDDPTVHPGALEACNEVDDDCDGEVDEDAGLVWYLDEDGDGWGGEALTQCDPPAQYADNGADCDDADPDVHPGAPEQEDGIDNDCDDVIDEGSSGGGEGVDITAAWDRNGVTIVITDSTAAGFELGMAETGSGSGGWYGETCIVGSEPGGRGRLRLRCLPQPGGGRRRNRERVPQHRRGRRRHDPLSPGPGLRPDLLRRRSGQRRLLGLGRRCGLLHGLRLHRAVAPAAVPSPPAACPPAVDPVLSGRPAAGRLRRNDLPDLTNWRCEFRDEMLLLITKGIFKPPTIVFTNASQY